MESARREAGKNYHRLTKSVVGERRQVATPDRKLDAARKNYPPLGTANGADSWMSAGRGGMQSPGSAIDTLRAGRAESPQPMTPPSAPSAAGSGNAAAPSDTADGTVRYTKAQELRGFLFLTVVMAPVLTVLVVTGYGFVVWMYQLIGGPPTGG